MTTVTVSRPSVSAPPHRWTLPNGLRIIAAPRTGTGVVAVAVHYGVGYRSEPADRAGFAHLFEHLMFQGSENVAKLEHLRRIQAAGGSSNAVTARDHTCYHDVVPAAALDLALFLESDRMRAPRLSAEDIATQLKVIREEIGANVLGRPYGGMPWLLLPPILFSSYANTHNGYGAVDELSTATVAECDTFFAHYYRPDNAVVTVAGDVDADTVRELVERHFAPIPAPALEPVRPSDALEPPPDAERTGRHEDRLAYAPATAYGWRLTGLADRHAYIVLAAVLAGGDAAALRRDLIAGGLASSVSAMAGLTGEAYESRDPDAFVLTAMHRPGAGGEPALRAAVDTELHRLATDGPSDDELADARTRSLVARHRRLGRLKDLAQALGTAEILHGSAELPLVATERIAGCTAADVARAADALRQAHRAVLHVDAGVGGGAR